MCWLWAHAGCGELSAKRVLVLMLIPLAVSRRTSRYCARRLRRQSRSQWAILDSKEKIGER